MRVTLQVATDFGQPAFAAVGASGAIEVLAFTLWGVHLWRVMSGRSLHAESGRIGCTPPPIGSGAH
jgi:hypothetical protein